MGNPCGDNIIARAITHPSIPSVPDVTEHLQKDAGLVRLDGAKIAQASPAASVPVVSEFAANNSRENSTSALAPDSTWSKLGIAARDIPAGIRDAIENESFAGMAKTAVQSAAVGAFLKTVLPEGGAIAKVGSAAIGGYFLWEQGKPIVGSVSEAVNAQTMDQLHHAGHKFGEVAGTGLVNLPAAYVGFKAGAGVADKVLASEGMDGFAETKANFFAKRISDNKFFSGIKEAPGSFSANHTAGSFGLASRVLIQGDRASLLDSARSAPEGEKLAAVDLNQQMDVSLMLRSKATDANSAFPEFRMDRMLKRVGSGNRAPLSDSELGAKFGAAPEAVAEVTKFAADNGLTITDQNLISGRVVLKGTVGQMQKAFNVQLDEYKGADGTNFRGREGLVSLPSSMATHVTGVLGLDTRPLFKPRYVRLDDAAAAATTVGDAHGAAGPNVEDIMPHGPAPRRGQALSVDQVKKAYGATGDGEGLNSAFISLGGDMPSNWNASMQAKGIDPSTFKIINTSDGALTPDPQGADVENLLDAAILKFTMPKANVSMVAGANSDTGFIAAIDRATFPQAGDLPNGGQNTAVSISWGSPEDGWNAQGIDSMNSAFKKAALKGVTFTAAAGDDGAVDRSPSGQAQTDFPSSSPWIVAAGGTELHLNPDGTIKSEITWGGPTGGGGATGGGRSIANPRPDYQEGMKLPPNINPAGKNIDGRATPDASANAAPISGWELPGENGTISVGGTSASAPALNAYFTLLKQQTGKSIGFANPTLYKWGQSNPSVYNDITKGNNQGYNAGPGWDATTGWGSINFPNMAKALANEGTFAANVKEAVPKLVKPNAFDAPAVIVPIHQLQQQEQNK